MKRVLLLGGSAQQIPAIVTARGFGYCTVLCDYYPDNPGCQHADKFYCLSTTDRRAILEVAQNEKVDGIVAYASDPAAPTAAYVAEQMGLPGNPYASVEILTTKDLFRQFLDKNGFSTPKARGFSNIQEARQEIYNFKLPAFVKPVDSSGSKGVSKLDDTGDLERLAEYALSFSRCHRFIIEEYVDNWGYQVAGDGFSVDGQLVFRCFGNDHFDLSNLNPYAPVAASFPFNMSQRLQTKIHGEIQRLLLLLKMKTGAYNFDIRIDNDENVYLMEIGPRNGGNYIPQVIKHATGIDLMEYTLRAAVGEDCTDLQMREPQGYWGYYAIHSHIAGILRDVKIEEETKNNHIVETHLNYDWGDKVPAYTGSNGTIGILIMKFASMKEMLSMMDHSDSWIKVLVE